MSTLQTLTAERGLLAATDAAAVQLSRFANAASLRAGCTLRDLVPVLSSLEGMTVYLASALRHEAGLRGSGSPAHEPLQVAHRRTREAVPAIKAAHGFAFRDSRTLLRGQSGAHGVGSGTAPAAALRARAVDAEHALLGFDAALLEHGGKCGPDTHDQVIGALISSLSSLRRACRTVAEIVQATYEDAGWPSHGRTGAGSLGTAAWRLDTAWHKAKQIPVEG